MLSKSLLYIKQKFKYFPVIVFIITIICYACVFVPPNKFWPAGIITHAILPLLGVNIILFIILLYHFKKTVLWSFLSIVFGLYFIHLTFRFKENSEEIRGKNIINVLSLNADFFQRWQNKRQSSVGFINWVVNDSSDIKCIQEFKTNESSFDSNIILQMSQRGYVDYNYTYQNPIGDQVGLAIFSKYPIINQGTLLFNKDSKNNCIYTDIKIAEDTMRIYNIHLSSFRFPSLSIRYFFRFDLYLKSLLIKLKNGSIKHAREIDLLINHTSNCSYSYIICGDFNESPYGYNYLKLKKHYKNSFDEAGFGTGFSFNGWLFFLRIDHHFVSNNMRPVIYRIDRSIRQSGHFPTRGIYEIIE